MENAESTEALEVARARLPTIQNIAAEQGNGDLASAIRIVRLAEGQDQAPLVQTQLLPSQILLEWATLAGVLPSLADLEGLRALDRLEPALRQPLADVLLRYVELHQIALATFPDSVAAAWTTFLIDPSGVMPELPDLAALRDARLRLLDALAVLQQAPLSISASAACENVPKDPAPPLVPLFGIDVVGCDNDWRGVRFAIIDLGGDDQYRGDNILSLDLAGNDLYLNNAGGANGIAAVMGQEVRVLCLAMEKQTASKSALAYDARGDDRYMNTISSQTGLGVRSCGINGGAILGSGMLVDGDGTDQYSAQHRGVNGGTFGPGLGLLLDADDPETGAPGHELVRAHGSGHVYGVNGGAMLGGAAMLINTRGDTRYSPEDNFQGDLGLGMNGGAASCVPVNTATDTVEFLRTGNNPGSDPGCLNHAGADTRGFLYDGGGNDEYGSDGGGTNGGGFGRGATGLLIDAGGNDFYNAYGYSLENLGTQPNGEFRATTDGLTLGGNGGGDSNGVGALIDLGGIDHYETYRNGGNGGGSRFGVGLLIDTDDEDGATGTQSFLGQRRGINGGGFLGGLGFLISDGPTNDRYERLVHDHMVPSNFTVFPHRWGIHGGAYSGGHGFLYDGQGDDRYEGDGEGAAGGAYMEALDTFGPNVDAIGWVHGTSGFLYDAQGDDTYAAGQKGVHGGGYVEGVTFVPRFSAAPKGFLYDGQGFDQYTAGDRGVNGGGYQFGIGTLIDDGTERDEYRAGSHGTNGGGGFHGQGFLVDAGGNDLYEAGSEGVNGGGKGAGNGLLLDRSGNDVYNAQAQGSNGGAHMFGTGALLDLAGTDTYIATSQGANGGASAGEHCPQKGLLESTFPAAESFFAALYAPVPCDSAAQVGLLFDGGGNGDTYQDNEGGTGTDVSIYGKGNEPFTPYRQRMLQPVMDEGPCGAVALWSSLHDLCGVRWHHDPTGEMAPHVQTLQDTHAGLPAADALRFGFQVDQ